MLPTEKTKVVNWIMKGKDNKYIVSKLPHISSQSVTAVRRYVKNGTYDKMKAKAINMLRKNIPAKKINKQCPIFTVNQIAAFASHYK